MNRDRHLGETGGHFNFRPIDLKTVDRANPCLRRLSGNPDASAHDDIPSFEAPLDRCRLHGTAAAVNESLEDYRFDEAARCDLPVLLGRLLRLVSRNRQAAARLQTSPDGTEKIVCALQELAASQVSFESSLRLLSPFMPFITEELWHAFYDGKPPAKSIALMPYPRRENLTRDRGGRDGDGASPKPITADPRTSQRNRRRRKSRRAHRGAHWTRPHEESPKRIATSSSVWRA